MRKFLKIIGAGLEGLRKTLHLLLLVVLFGAVIGAMRGSIPVIPNEAALVLRPEGAIVEQVSGDPLQRALAEARGSGRDETLLRDLTEAIEAAGTDERIKTLVIDFDAMSGAGQPTLDEFSRAIKKFRESGKKVIAIGTYFTRDTYYVAAHADELYLDPMGIVVLEGYERYRNYYKEALDSLGIDVNVFRVGSYKSAVEPYIRNDMSAEDREASQVFVNSLWESYITAVASARDLPQESLRSYVDTFSPVVKAAKGDTAKVALDSGLVSGLKTAQEVEERVLELAARDKDNDSYRRIGLDNYLRVVRAEDKVSRHPDARIAVLVGSGEIVDGGGTGGVISGDAMSALIRQARMDEDIKALVLRIDSPGGSVMASEQIYRELQAFRATDRPVVVSMGDLAASGGYYIAAPAHEIWASPATITGSIGIFGLFPTAPRTFDKLGIGVDGVGTTPLSGELRLDRPIGPAASMLLQATIERGYEDFLKRVMDGREMARDEVDAIAQGRVWSGRDAKRLGLVDNLGSLEQAIEAAARRAELEPGKYELDYLDPDLSVVQQVLTSLQAKARVWLVQLLGLNSAEYAQWAAISALSQDLGPLPKEILRFNRHVVPGRIYAHCFCTPY
jgi:protease-4